MKIGIVTIIDYKNYGNRLQNFAMQELLKSLGAEVETIVNNSIDPNKDNAVFLKYVTRMKVLGVRGIIYRIIEKIKGDPKEKLLSEKKQKFKEFSKFSKAYFKETDYNVDPFNMSDVLIDQYDFFVAGSDQIWNPIFRHGSSFDFLAFAPRDKRIAYAPSFGISYIPYKYKDAYTEWLNGFSYLSVREDAGAQIIESLTSKKVPVLVDPTLLLTKEEWIKFSTPL